MKTSFLTYRYVSILEGCFVETSFAVTTGAGLAQCMFYHKHVNQTGEIFLWYFSRQCNDADDERLKLP